MLLILPAEKLEIPLAMGNIASDNRHFVALGFASAGVALGTRTLHTPADSVETVDPDAMKKAAELFLMTIWKLAYVLN
jgi:aminopeptidase YwaD